MTPEREKEIRTWVTMRYGAYVTKVFNSFEELLKEIDRLRADLRTLMESDHRFRDNMSAVLKETSDIYHNHVKELKAECAGLRESIRVYGGHCGGCEVFENAPRGPGVCTCGFHEVYEKATIKNERTESNSNAVEKPGGV